MRFFNLPIIIFFTIIGIQLAGSLYSGRPVDVCLDVVNLLQRFSFHRLQLLYQFVRVFAHKPFNTFFLTLPNI